MSKAELIDNNPRSNRSTGTTARDTTDSGTITAPVRIDYQGSHFPDSELPTSPQPESTQLASISFTDQTQQDASDPACLTVGLPNLDLQHPLREVWTAARPVTKGFQDGIGFSFTDDILFAHILLDESSFDDIDHGAYTAYTRLLQFIEDMGFPHMLRVWNYFPDINQQGRSIERYKGFCAGRYDALISTRHFEQSLPAASAIGTHSKGLLVYLIASKEPGIQVENPRQISAYRYPPRYGKKSPSFSRATFKSWPESDHFYISGTASVVGHETRHLNDCMAQLDETLVNIQSLIEECHAKHSRIHSVRDMDLLKVYIRHPADFPAIKTKLTQVIGTVPTLYLQGDICREDLLLEIEGFYCAAK